MQAYEQLERSWSEWNGLDPAGMVACASGSAALHLAIEALQLPQGSQVIVPDFGMIACARAVTLAGLEPVFVDCGEDLLMDQKLWAKALDINTYAVMFVHIYGRRCTFPKSWDNYIASLRIIEDLAEAHGVKPHPQTDAACYSFYRNKIIAGEEGGAVYFRNPAHAALARQLRSLGFTDDHDFTHIPRGWNHRMSNVHASLILKSLELVEANIALRRYLEQWYDAKCPDEWRMPPRDAPWVYDIRIPSMTREQQTRVVKALQAAGIAARHAFKPMHLQEEYRNCRVIGGEVAERMSREVIYLPLDGKAADVDAFAVITKSL